MEPDIALSPLRQVWKKDTVSCAEGGYVMVLCWANSPWSATKGTFTDELLECFSDIWEKLDSDIDMEKSWAEVGKISKGWLKLVMEQL